MTFRFTASYKRPCQATEDFTNFEFFVCDKTSQEGSSCTVGMTLCSAERSRKQTQGTLTPQDILHHQRLHTQGVLNLKHQPRTWTQHTDSCSDASDLSIQQQVMQTSPATAHACGQRWHGRCQHQAITRTDSPYNTRLTHPGGIPRCC